MNLTIYLIFLIFLTLILLSIFNQKLYKHYIIIKTLTSFTFCLISLKNILYYKNFHLSILFLSIIFCFIGDIFLAFYNKYNNKINFCLGLLFFLSAHILFVINYHLILDLSYYDLIFPIVCIMIVLVLEYSNLINLNKLKLLVIIYTFFVSLLVAKAFNMSLILNTKLSYYLLSASLLFFISDFFILLLYFGYRNKYIHFFNLITYYLAMLLFALALI